jgi:hypothetical protein
MLIVSLNKKINCTNGQLRSYRIKQNLILFSFPLPMLCDAVLIKPLSLDRLLNYIFLYKEVD